MTGHKAVVGVVIIFFLGICNFALHRAVLESGHAMLDRMPREVRRLAGRFTLVVEFVVLLSAMLFAANGWPALVWVYLLYSLANGISAWLILNRRI